VAIRLIHLGAGIRGRHWLELVAEHPDFESVACVDNSETALQQARTMPGQQHGHFYRTFEEALSQVKADGVLVSSPSFLHAPHAIQSLDAGLGVMVEKPIGLTLPEALTVVEHQRRVKLPVMVAENYRFFPAERTVRDLLEKGVAGRVGSAVCIDRRDQPSDTLPPWVKGMKQPFLTEIAVHHFDSFRYFFGRAPVAISAQAYNPPGSTYEGCAAAEAVIEFDAGVRVQYVGTMGATRYEYSLWIEGERGDIWTDRKRVWWRPKGKRFFGRVALVPVPKGDERPYPHGGTMALLDQFRDALKHGKVPDTNAADNLWTLAMVDASIASDSQGREVHISEVFTPAMKTQAGLGSSGEGPKV
jgi:predicted dehydrogenase